MCIYIYICVCFFVCVLMMIVVSACSKLTFVFWFLFQGDVDFGQQRSIRFVRGRTVRSSPTVQYGVNVEENPST